MLQHFYSSNPAVSGHLQPNTDMADTKCLSSESLTVYHTLPAVLFWSLLDIPLWFTASGLVVYVAIVFTGAVGSLCWAALLS